MTLAFKIWDISDLPLIGFLKPVRYEMPKRGCSSTLFWFKSGLLHKRLNMVFKIKAFKMLLGWLLRTSSRSLLKYNFLSFLLVCHPTLVVFCISRKRFPDLYYLFFSEIGIKNLSKRYYNLNFRGWKVANLFWDTDTIWLLV